jgi:hypothetical protein
MHVPAWYYCLFFMHSLYSYHLAGQMLLSKIEASYYKLLRSGKQVLNRASTLKKPGVADFVSSGPIINRFFSKARAKTHFY